MKILNIFSNKLPRSKLRGIPDGETLFPNRLHPRSKLRGIQPFENKVFILYATVIILMIAGGFLFWQRYKSNKSISPNPLPTISPTPQYPKVTSFQAPILMYHYIRDAYGESQLGKNLSVAPENFETHLKWFKENGYETLTVADLTDHDTKVLSKIVYEKKKPIVLTFDDGYEDAYTQAYPLLIKYEMAATFYIIRDYVGRDNYMNQAQIDELEANGMEIGSHSLSHPDLTKINPKDAQRQIADSKENATTFCYPAGKYNTTTVNLVQEAGYRAAVTTHSGIATENSNILELPRVRVENGSGESLGRKIEAAFE